MSDDKKVEAPKPPAPSAGPPPKPAPKNPGFVTFTVDGKEVVAKPGTNMIEAAKQVGVEIPYFCYHQRLSISANCRMCMVEVSNAPKLVPACQTPIGEGLAVKTSTPKVRDQQRQVMEFLLLNHPVDCSICDQAGECKLQDYYMRYDHRCSRLDGGKVQKNKRKALGPNVVLDQERCILCSRCVRFMAEVAKEPQLAVFGRGSHERIDTFPGTELDSKYSLNTVDLCPVGALLSRDFRFRARAWFLSAAPSVCAGCARGCTTWVDYMGQDAYRFRPRENEAINKSWMCDPGRATYRLVNTPRFLSSLVGRGVDQREVAAGEAAKYAAMKLKPLVGTGGLAMLVSPQASNEDLMAALSFAHGGLGLSSVYVGGRPDGEADALLMLADKNPNRKGLAWIAKALGVSLKPVAELGGAIESGAVKALVAVGTEVPDSAAFDKQTARLELFVALALNESPAARNAHVVLATSSHVEEEGSFTQEAGITQRFRRAFPPKGDSHPHWWWATQLWKDMGGEVGWASSRDVFVAVAPKVSELKDFAWDASAPASHRSPGITPFSTAADGRTPGYRELGTPRVRGI